MSLYSELKNVGQWLLRKFSYSQSHVTETIQKHKDLPPVTFNQITFTNSPPKNHEINANEFWLSVKNDIPQWVLFKCPCGCGYIVTLPIQHPHNPRWRISQTKRNRPSLHPSVWQKTSCRSHFWINDGRIYWA